MNELPLVSIAIPAFNPEFLSRALHSAIAQRYANLEVIVCDDSQGDEVKAVFDLWAGQARCALRYVRNPSTLGFSRNVLMCLEQARGTFIKFLCDDDWLVEGCIGQSVQVMLDCPDVNVLVHHRLICAADETLLPMRQANCMISASSAVVNGGDLLEAIESNVPNLFGGISHSLLRRTQVQEFLPQLVQDGAGFRARLVEALFICLLRRGHLAYLTNMLSFERVHPGRLSHHTSMTLAFATETEWLRQMLASRTSEPAPATGWVRHIPLEHYTQGADKAWQEFEMTRIYARQLAGFQQQVGSSSLSFTELYSEWLGCRTLSSAQVDLLPKRVEQWPRRPRIDVLVLSAEGDALALKATLDSLHQQSYVAANICVLAPAGQPLLDAAVLHLHTQGHGIEQLNSFLAREGAGDWVFLLRAGDCLHPHALVIMAERMALHPDCACLYTDEGTNDNLQPSQPIFKPDFNLDLMRSVLYVGRLLAFDSARVLELGGFDPQFDMLAPHDLLWRLVESRGLSTVGHVAELLVQSRHGYNAWQMDPTCIAQAPKVLRAHLARLGVEAELVSVEGSMVSRVQYQHVDTPVVSIIIAAGREVKSLMSCVESILEHTAYRNYEILIVANGSESVEVQGWLAAMQELCSERLSIVQVQAQSGSALYNQASLQALGSYLLLLDAGCVCFDAQWLDEMVRHAQRPEVGVVGPKLCSMTGNVTGAGLVLGLHGLASSPFFGHPADTNGYMSRLACVQNFSAVSRDCLMVRRELFNEIGGLDGNTFPDELGDADLCLRARDRGYLIVWTPFAVVAQAAPQTSKTNEQLQDTFYERWLPRVANDPAYNHNLSLRMANFNLEPGLREGWAPFIEPVLPFVMALPINTSAVGHYRVSQPFQELERAGWIQGRLNYMLPSPIELERSQPDVIILQCRYTTGSLEEMARIKRLFSARRIYEIDDYIIDVPERNEHRRNMPGNMREMVSRGIALCDRLVVSTEPLADALSDMHHDIRVVPNMLCGSLWGGLKGRRQTSARPRVGWAGGTSHRGDLELLADVVRTLANEVDWVFFGMCPDVLRPYIKEFHAGVQLHLYPQKLASLNLDLALAPLEQNLFNDCKSNLRLLEYGACGFPVVCADTKAYQGYLPCTRVVGNSSRAWLEAIRMHLADPQASYRQGDELRETVLRDFVLTQDKLQHWANAWLAD